VLRSGISLRPFLALTLVVAVTAGGGVPAQAQLHDIFPFFRSAPEEPVPDPIPYTVTLTVVGADRRLERALRAASGLVEREKTPASGLVGLIARARQDVGRLTAVLYENARNAGEISILIDGRPIESLDPFFTIAARPVPVAIAVSAGPPFVFGRVEAAPLPAGLTLGCC
jgi:translocation and assembly module TamA